MITRRDLGSTCLGAGATLALALANPSGVSAQSSRTRSKSRIALVVGVQRYDLGSGMPPLLTPEADANAVADKLQRMGFESIKLIDPTTLELFRAIAKLTEDARTADLIVVYYAGHGIQATRQGSKVEQIFVPRDFREPAAQGEGRDAAFETAIDNNRLLTLGKIKQQIEAGKALGIVFWDACRVNPFSNSQIALASSHRQASVVFPGARTRAPDLGAAPGSDRPAPERQQPVVNRAHGFVVHNAAESGKPASDGSGAHSPFTTALLKHIDRPGQELMAMLGAIGTDVNRLTSGQQTPSIEGTVLGPQVVLVPSRAPAQASAPAGSNRSATTATGNVGSSKGGVPGRESVARTPNGQTYTITTRDTSPFE